MRTDTKQYSDYLEAKYLPGRRFYLNWMFYPKILRCFRTSDTIIDLGCGTGEFLNHCRRRNRDVVGVDSNETLVEKCRRNGFNVVLDNVCELSSLKEKRFTYAICDNVLEHLDMEELDRFFRRVDGLLVSGGILACIVPGIKGFKNDPTHKTYVCYDLLMNLLKTRNMKIETWYYHPVNLKGVDRFFYLNMQVFEISKR